MYSTDEHIQSWEVNRQLKNWQCLYLIFGFFDLVYTLLSISQIRNVKLDIYLPVWFVGNRYSIEVNLFRTWRCVDTWIGLTMLISDWDTLPQKYNICTCIWSAYCYCSCPCTYNNSNLCPSAVTPNKVQNASIMP